ncbi:protein POLYCHOME-like [Telopea speciosissima]|uniref:protein POLYCHOME-like n=1 Tax=Telopea speciosissima TaxID=54955 RepID=UPI001CC6B566|nr:protein POLYCHOME-like [Telopea speciosissima]
MPESRDRLVRRDPIELLFVLRRGVAGIPQDTGPQRSFFVSPSRPEPQRGLFASPSRTVNDSGGGGRNLFATSLQRGSMANTVQRWRTGGPARRGRGRGSTNNSPIPSWYQRRPLRDVTDVVRAIERRRSHLTDPENAQLQSPLPAPLEQNTFFKTPKPRTAVKPCTPSTSRLSKVLQDFDKKNPTEFDFITPQKKLLNSIEQVEKVVLEEFRKIEKSRSAKKVQREKKVRTLMSIR